MPQAIAETTFDVLYLSFAIITGIIMLIKGRSSLVKKAGLMSVLLGAGDSFHLVPRAYALCTTGLEAHAAALGFGKFVTSITMTIFYLILYHIWCDYYEIGKRIVFTKTVQTSAEAMPSAGFITIKRKTITIVMLILAALRIGLCLLPQNQWLSYRQPLLYGILRNIPFALIGLIIIFLFAQQNKQKKDSAFRFMPLAVALSFGFYLPVVLFSGTLPIIGMLMIPKTLAYVWIILMGWKIYQTQVV